MVTWDAVSIYAGYLIALLLCRGLGWIFFVPMLLNLVFDLCLRFGLLAGWDIRWTMVSYGLLFFLWVLTLSGFPNKTVFIVVMLADLGSVFHGLAPEMSAVGTGSSFWDTTSTSIVHVWLTSIFVVSVSVIFRGTVLSMIERGYADLLVVPKQRFLIPIALWSGMIMIPFYLHGVVPEWLYEHRFALAVQLLVWGWVAFELPFYIMYKRMHERSS